MRKREKMSSVDTAWLRMDRPTNLMMIVGVLIFDGVVDYERLKSTVRRRIEPFRRFRQRVFSDATGAYWEDDPAFDIDMHVERVRLPGRAGKRELERYVASLVSTPLDDSRPLWHFALIENYERGSAVVSRIHHCIADGIALVGVMLKMTDATPDGDSITESAQATEASLDVDETDDDETDAETDLWKQLLAPMTAAAIRTIDYSGKGWSE
jgi:WS/DGAT/MGAT family acyltransferase